MSQTRYLLGAQNAWTEIDPATVGNDFLVTVTDAGTFQMAVSDAEPAGAGTVIEADVAQRVIIPVGSANSAWVRNVAAAGGGRVSVDDLIGGQVFIGA